MNVQVFPNSNLAGTLIAPPSKSAMQRVCALALLSKGKTSIYNPGYSNDDKVALNIIQDLGAKIIFQNDEKIIVESKGIIPQKNEINCGESGLSIRMFTPLIAFSEKNMKINGTGSLLNRPMDFFDTIFPSLQVQIKTNAGKLPISIQGILQAKNIEIDGSLSSQFLTGLIFAFVAAEKKENVSIKVNQLKSKPYIDLTLDLLKKFGVHIQHTNYENFVFKLEDTLNQENIYTVEGDWSSVSFLLVAGALAGKIGVLHADINSTQGDKKILEALKDSGAKMTQTAQMISVEKAPLKSFQFDATDCPDLFPPLVALAAFCEGVSKIKGVSRLQYKESNRAITLQMEFGKLGYRIDLNDDEMHIYGNQQPVKGGLELSSHHDHRIAMACTLASLNCLHPNIITHAEAINKSYPNFYEHMKLVGAKIV